MLPKQMTTLKTKGVNISMISALMPWRTTFVYDAIGLSVSVFFLIFLGIFVKRHMNMKPFYALQILVKPVCPLFES